MDKVSSGHGPAEVSQQLAQLFASRGWLNQRLKLDYQGSRYWVSCGPDAFVAYRVNQDWGQSPGAPGWPVCIVTLQRVFDESDLFDRPDVSDMRSPSPTAQDWLAILANGQFKLA